MQASPGGDDLLWLHLTSLPAFRAMLRATEARFYRRLALEGPILDLGAGDGHFASFAFRRPPLVGLDPWWSPLQKAKKRVAHTFVLQGAGESLPFAGSSFATVVSNSVLEHIPEIMPVLHEVRRVLEPGGQLLFTTPSHYFDEFLAGVSFFRRLGLGSMAARYRRFFNRISRHQHVDSPEIWAKRLATAGFAVRSWHYYFSPGALRALEIGHLQGLPSAVLHAITGHWIIAPWKSNLRATERWVRPFYDEELPEAGAYFYMAAQKVADRPAPVRLPPPSRPAKLDLAVETPVPAMPEIPPADLTPVSPDYGPGEKVKSPLAVDSGPARDTTGRARWMTAGRPLLFLLSVASAWIAISILRSDSAGASSAVAWVLLLFALLAVARASEVGTSLAQSGWISLNEIPGRRWLIIPALILSLVASNRAADPLAHGPGAALILWLLAIALGVLALWKEGEPALLSGSRTSVERWEVPALLAITAAAVLLRFVALDSHPFVLSGSEASLGLDAWAFSQGLLSNPFTTGWLTNPTLPSFLMSIPIGVLGRSVLSVRLLSALVGSLTVPMIYLAGRRMFSPLVGLLAAVLLTGSHVHLHYSRVGLTNVWDALLLLGAILTLYAAWQGDSRNKWLAAGIIVGLNAYVFTAARTLPVIIVILALAFIGKSAALRNRRAGVGTAMAMAFVVLLPQFLHYRAQPDAYMDRARSVGIIGGNWLEAESAGAGVDEFNAILRQFWNGIFAYQRGRDTSIAFNSGVPLLSFWTSLLLLVGVGLAFVRREQVRFALLLVALTATLVVAGILVQNPPASHRLLIGLPIVFVLAAVALAWLAHRLAAAFSASRQYALIGALAVAILLAVSDASFYFGRYRSEHRYGDRNTEIAHEISGFLNQLEGPHTVYFHGPPSMYAGFPTFEYLVLDWRSEIQMIDVPDDQPVESLVAGARRVHVFLPERSDELPLVSERWQGGEALSFPGANASPLFYTYLVPE